MKKSTTPKIVPIHDRVLVKAPKSSKEEKGEKTIGGIIIPQVSGQTERALDSIHILCDVIAAGPDCTQVKPGDHVAVRKQDLFVMTSDILGVEQTLIFEKHIMAVVR